MTAREYLEARGWIQVTDAAGDPEWICSVMPTDVTALTTDSALAVQRARDAAEARAAWVAFAAAALSVVSGTMAEHAKCADALLSEYRARFSVEVTP